MTYDKLVKFLSTYKKCSYVKILYKIDVGTNKAKANHYSVNKLVRMTVRIGLNYKPTANDIWFSPTNISGIVKVITMKTVCICKRFFRQTNQK